MATTFSEAVRFNGTVTMPPTVNNFPIEALPQRDLQVYTIPLTQFRVWDAMQTNLPGTAATDDLALIGSTTFGTNSLRISAGDLKAAGATTRRMRALIQLPAEYVAGQTVTLRLYAGMETTVADTTATVDVEAYLTDYEGAVSGSDLVTTAATSINSTTFSAKDFQLTATSLTAGDWLDVRISVAVNDAATGTAVDAAIGYVRLLCDTKG